MLLRLWVSVSLLFTCLGAAAQSQDLSSLDADSLYRVASTARIDSNRLIAATALTRIHYQHGRFDSSLQYARLSSLLAQTLHRKKDIARSFYNIGLVYTSMTMYDSASFYLDKAAVDFKALDDTEMLVQYYNTMASLYNYQSDNANATAYMLKALQLLEERPGTALNYLLPQLTSNIGYLFQAENQPDKNISYQCKALVYRAHIRDSTNFSNIFNNLFNAYMSKQDLANARTALDSAAYFNRLYHNQESEIFILNNYGYYFETSGDTAAALPWYLKAYRLSDSLNNTYYKAPIAGSLAKAYLSRHQLELAAKYATISNAISLELKNYPVVADTYALLKTIEQRKGNFRQALLYAELNKQYADSASTAETKKNVLQLETKYQAEKKEKEIADLTVANQQNELAVIKRNRILLVVGLAAAALVLILLLLYRNSKQKQLLAEKDQDVREQHIRFLEKQQQVVSMQSMVNGQETERTRIARDLHDGLGGLFSTIKMQLSTLKHEEQHLDDNPLFSKSYALVDNAANEVRRIAHNMMPEVLMKLGLVEAVRDMSNNINSGKLLRVSLQTYGMEARLSQSTEIMLYRIIQELLNNVIKHAQASEALIQFNRQSNRLSVTVEDNGKGFNTQRAEQDRKAGLETIQHRVSYLKGRLSIDSQQGLGTTVMMDFLLHEEAV